MRESSTYIDGELIDSSYNFRILITTVKREDKIIDYFNKTEDVFNEISALVI